MPSITPALVAKSIRIQESMSLENWLAHGDVLFAKQRVMFLEIVSFGRDGVEESQLRGMVDFLAVLQRAAESVSAEVAAPVEMPEFSAAVERAVLWFKTLESDSRKEMAPMVDAWFKGIQQRGEPTIWALLMNLIQEKRIIDAPLASGMVITLHAVADVYSTRIGCL